MTGVFDDHLSLDAVVAYADGEMSMTAYQRAAAHLVRCGPCAADVAEQTAASHYLRGAQVPTMPSSLFAALTSIPIAVPVTPAPSDPWSPPGDAHPATGRSRRFRLGAGALVAGIAVGAVMVAATGDTPADPAGPPPVDRTAVSDPTAVAPGGVLRTTVINVLGRSSSATR